MIWLPVALAALLGLEWGCYRWLDVPLPVCLMHWAATAGLLAGGLTLWWLLAGRTAENALSGAEVAAVRELLCELGSSADSREVARASARYLARAVGSDGGAVVVVSGLRARDVVAEGLPDSTVALLRRVCFGSEEWCRRLRYRTRLRLGEAGGPYPYVEQALPWPEAGAGTGRGGLRPVAVVPLRGHGRVAGIFVGPVDRRFDARLLVAPAVTAVADAVGLALEKTLACERLQHQAVTDRLTGLYNRRYLEALLGGEVRLRLGPRVGVVMLDIDGLKQVNDLYGHMWGDRAIMATADLIRRVFRRSDVAIRYGGDEFLVLMSAAEEEDLAGPVARLKEAAASAAVRYGLPEPLRLSVGCAAWPPAACLRDALAVADRRMYREKQQRQPFVARLEPLPGPAGRGEGGGCSRELVRLSAG